jgi:hypothetical protein
MPARSARRRQVGGGKNELLHLFRSRNMIRLANQSTSTLTNRNRGAVIGRRPGTFEQAVEFL